MPPPANPPPSATEPRLKIYFLPNLLTAGNLFCGFVALTKIVEADIPSGDFSKIKYALGFILLACIFDLFDGRVARMGGCESPFGREFDSLADVHSFAGEDYEVAVVPPAARRLLLRFDERSAHYDVRERSQF